MPRPVGSIDAPRTTGNQWAARDGGPFILGLKRVTACSAHPHSGEAYRPCAGSFVRSLKSCRMASKRLLSGGSSMRLIQLCAISRRAARVWGLVVFRASATHSLAAFWKSSERFIAASSPYAPTLLGQLRSRAVNWWLGAGDWAGFLKKRRDQPPRRAARIVSLLNQTNDSFSP